MFHLRLPVYHCTQLQCQRRRVRGRLQAEGPGGLKIYLGKEEHLWPWEGRALVMKLCKYAGRSCKC